MINNYNSVKAGIILSLLSMFFSFLLGGFFGLNEEYLKSHLHNSAMEKFETHYKSDEEKVKQVTSKSWVYFQRSHLHAGVLGIGALGMCLLLGFIGKNNRETMIASVALGLGGMLYGLFWFLAGWNAPALGGTGAAKEAYVWLGIGAPFLYLAGSFLTLKSALIYKSKKE